MRYLALALDYDNTLARQGRASEAALLAIDRLRISGRRVILVTGRRLDDLLTVCQDLRRFDFVVAENGAVVLEPASREELVLARRPPERFVRRLREHGVEPLEVGRVVVATREPHAPTVLEAIRDLGLGLQVIFNRTEVMVLPAGVTKATGLEYALRRLGLSFHEVVGVGDAENDHSFLERCECAVAVANAIPPIKEAAAFVTERENGEGVTEVIDELIATDLRRLEGSIAQNLVLLGHRPDGTEVRVPPYGRNVLVAGPSASGKSTFATGLIERLMGQAYQLCVVDPEGDYGALRDLVSLGNQRRAPTVNEVLSILGDPAISLSVNLLGIPLADRPRFFAELVPNLQALRARTGRPHWVVLDEAHHMLPATWGLAPLALPQRLGEMLLVTVHPEHVTPAILAMVDVVIAVGDSPAETLRQFGAATGRPAPWPEGLSATPGSVITWFAHEPELPFSMRFVPGRAERIRHHRKYAEGNVRYHSFYFRGPGGRHNLRAQNLGVFCQIAEGIDEDTWLFHLRRGDYSRWFREVIKDDYLADEMARIERRSDLGARESRRLTDELVRAHYTLPE